MFLPALPVRFLESSDLSKYFGVWLFPLKTIILSLKSCEKQGVLCKNIEDMSTDVTFITNEPNRNLLEMNITFTTINYDIKYRMGIESGEKE
jgi:hypothetical protein